MKLLNLSFFKSKGFIVSMIGIVCLIVSLIIYGGFNGTLLEYYSSNVVLPCLLGIMIYFVLLIIKPCEKYSPIALWVGTFVGFLLYINNVYMYFSGVFYNGVTAEAMKLLDMKVVLSIVFFVLSIIITNIAIYIPTKKEAK